MERRTAGWVFVPRPLSGIPTYVVTVAIMVAVKMWGKPAKLVGQENATVEHPTRAGRII